MWINAAWQVHKKEKAKISAYLRLSSRIMEEGSS
jgi:hypothetical protein